MPKRPCGLVHSSADLVASIYRHRYNVLVKVRFYETPAGQRPAEKYILGLPKKEAAAVQVVLEAIALEGLESADVKQIRGRLWEVRVKQQRIFYVLIVGPEMVLLHGCKKQSQKARTKDIETAESRMKEALNAEAKE